MAATNYIVRKEFTDYTANRRYYAGGYYTGDPATSAIVASHVTQRVLEPWASGSTVVATDYKVLIPFTDYDKAPGAVEQRMDETSLYRHAAGARVTSLLQERAIEAWAPVLP